MATPVLMPKLGESVVEGTVARWLKQPGEPVQRLEPLLEISTDKIDTEVPAPASGTLLAVHVAEGQTVAAGAVLATIGAADEALAPAPDAPAASQSTNPPIHQSTSPTAHQSPAPDAASDARPTGRAFVSPVVKRLAREHAVDLEQVPGTGLAGRVTKKDVLAFVEQMEQTPARSAAVPDAPAPDLAEVATDELLHPLSAMRRAIAQHMVLSVQTSPHVTTVFEVDMTAVVRHREAHKAEFAARGLSLTFMPYFVVAAAAALRAHPLANSRYTDAGIVEHRRIHIGVAVAVPGGLLVPVVRDADERTLAGAARAVADLAERARRSTLAPDDLHGGTFTITNHGVSGSLIGTPIIHQPQAAILGIGAIGKRAVVRSATGSLLPDADDAIVIRPMAYLSLSFDHRLLDGAAADAFVDTIKAALEEWTG
jgi:2-oxoglutarate dehydrogenase E2 component (dihydrolipoamide succinyltransferase)